MLFAVFVAMLGSIAGVMLGVVNVTKESHVAEAGAGALSVLTNKAGTSAVSTSSLLSPHVISSVLPDEAWSQLKQFTITSDVTQSTVSFMVLGWARIQSQGAYGSIVQLVTYAGTITLDGRTMSFSPDAAPVFEEAGFIVAGTRRRLLQSNIDIVGFFNYLQTFDLNALEGSALGIATPNTTFPAWPASFDLSTVTYIQCSAAKTPTWCFQDGAAFTDTHPDYPGKYFFTESATMVAGPAGRLTTTEYSYTSRVDVLYQDASGVIQGAMPSGIPAGGWINCAAGPPRPADDLGKDPFAMIRRLAVPPVFVDNNSTVNGRFARHFTFTATWTKQLFDAAAARNVTGNLPVGTKMIQVDYYDDVSTHYPLRLIGQNFVLDNQPPYIVDILSFVPDPNPAAAWPGPAPLADNTFGSSCPGNVRVITAGASLYPDPGLPSSYETMDMPELPSSGNTSGSDVATGRHLLGDFAHSNCLKAGLPGLPKVAFSLSIEACTTGWTEFTISVGPGSLWTYVHSLSNFGGSGSVTASFADLMDGFPLFLCSTVMIAQKGMSAFDYCASLFPSVTLYLASGSATAPGLFTTKGPYVGGGAGIATATTTLDVSVVVYPKPNYKWQVQVGYSDRPSFVSNHVLYSVGGNIAHK